MRAPDFLAALPRKRRTRAAEAAAALALLLASGTALGQPAPSEPLPSPPPGPATWRHEAGASPPASSPAPPASDALAAPAPLDLELGAVLGAAVRVDDAPHFEIIERAGLMFGASASLRLDPAFSLGLSFEHTDLGRERSAISKAAALEVTRDLNTLWASVRLDLIRGELGEIGLVFGPGLAWQSADVSGIAAPTLGGGTPFRCSASDPASFALRAGLDGSLALGGGLYFSTSTTIDVLELSSDFLDGCVPGAGSALLFGVRGGFGYRFDVGRYVR